MKNFRIPEDFRGKSKWIVQIWLIVEDTLFRWSPRFMYGWRRMLLRIFGAKIGKGVKIRPEVHITYPWKVEIGDWCWIGEGSVLYSLGNIKLGDNVALASYVYLNTGGHKHDLLTFDIYAEEIIIESEVWLTTDVFVASGVKIGRGTVVGARSTVLNNLPSGMICVGYPAKPIKKREMIK